MTVLLARLVNVPLLVNVATNGDCSKLTLPTEMAINSTISPTRHAEAKTTLVPLLAV
jgi:hypothetical protein